jgi:hypothetical protein
MTDRELAFALARQVLTESRDLGWLIPLAREFLKLVEHEPPPVPDRAYEVTAGGRGA